MIISSIEGSLSSYALVEKDLMILFVQLDFCCLNSEKINSEALLILFKSLVIQELLQRRVKGDNFNSYFKNRIRSDQNSSYQSINQNQIAEKNPRKPQN